MTCLKSEATKIGATARGGYWGSEVRSPCSDPCEAASRPFPRHTLRRQPGCEIMTAGQPV